MVAYVWFSRSTSTPSLASTAWCRPSLQRRPRHFAARILVDDDDLAFLDDVFHVFFVNAVGLQQLGGGVQARSRFVKLFGQFIFAAQFVFFRQARIFVHFREGGSQIRQHEIFRMAGGDDFPAFFHQVGVVGFFHPR